MGDRQRQPGDEGEARGASTAGGERVDPSTIREAQAAAERAIEQQAVPADRRSLIRRVYERLSQRAAEEAARQSEPPAEGGGP